MSLRASVKMSSLPVIDLSSPDRENTAKKIVKIMETVGFLYLDVRGFSAADEEELLAQCKWFFSLPKEIKMKFARYPYNKENKNYYRGYIGLDKDYHTYKEGFSFGHDKDTYHIAASTPAQSDKLSEIKGLPLTETNVWPQPEKYDSDEEKMKYEKFKETVAKHYKTMMTASLEFLSLLAIGLNLPEKYFNQFFLPQSLTTLRLQHYPHRDFTAPPIAIEEDGTTVICGTHCDNVFVTLLSTFHFPGLQVLLQDNSWLNVAPRPGSFVVNIGKTLSEMTGKKIKATQHRVIDVGIERFSVPFLVEPRFDAMIPYSLPLKHNKESLQTTSKESFRYGLWLIENMKKEPVLNDLVKEFERQRL